MAKKRPIDKARPIGGECDSYMTRVMPARADKTQRIETRRAFYAGALALWGLIFRLLDPNSDEPTEADLAAMNLIDDDLQKFLREVKGGRA